MTPISDRFRGLLDQQRIDANTNQLRAAKVTDTKRQAESSISVSADDRFVTEDHSLGSTLWTRHLINNINGTRTEECHLSQTIMCPQMQLTLWVHFW